MKTPILNIYESKLAEVNDQLCYFLFSDAEVVEHLAKHELESSEAFTTDVFPENIFSKRLHIKVNALTEFREKAFNTVVGTSLIAAVEYILYYLKEVEKYRSKLLPSNHDALSDDKAEAQLNKKIKAWTGANLDTNIIKTIKYLRLRRNHITHLSEEMSSDFESLIKNHSQALNFYWESKKTNIYDFDFSKSDFSSFSKNESLALINLARVCLKVIDEKIISSVTTTNIVEYEIVEFLKNKSLNGLTISRRASKFRGILATKYGCTIVCTDMEFEAYANNA